MTVTSPVSLSKVVTEFGSDGSPSLRDYYRGGPRVPNTTANAAISTSASSLVLSSFLNSNSYFSITVAANWGTTGTTGTVSSSTPALTVPSGTSTIRFEVIADSGGGATSYLINGADQGSLSDGFTLSVSNGTTVGFRKVGPGTTFWVEVYDDVSGAFIGNWYAG